MGTPVEKSVYVAVDIDEQNGDTIDLPTDKIAFPDLIKLDHCPPIAHLVSSLSILLNTGKPKQRLAPASRCRCNLTLGRSIACQSAHEIGEAGYRRVGARSPLGDPAPKHLAVTRTSVDGKCGKGGAPVITPLGIERQIGEKQPGLFIVIAASQLAKLAIENMLDRGPQNQIDRSEAFGPIVGDKRELKSFARLLPAWLRFPDGPLRQPKSVLRPRPLQLPRPISGERNASQHI